MSLSNTLTPFLYTFYLLGQSPYPSVPSPSTNVLQRFLLKVPGFVLVCASLCVTINFLRNDNFVGIIHIALIMSSLSTNLVIAYQSLFQGSSWIQLQELFSRLETEFQDLLPQTKVKLTKFRIWFLIKCTVTSALYFILLLAMIMSRITNEYFHTSYMIVLALTSDVCAFQVVFYVDLIQSFLRTITDAFQDFHGEAKFIMSMKKLHSKIFKIVEKVNEYFGLFLLSYIVQQFMVISFYIFWIFLNDFTFAPWKSLG